MNTHEHSERIDDWASRLIDGDIEIDVIEPSLRDDVLRRATQFREVRSMLSDSRRLTVSTTDSVVARAMNAPRPRRMTTYIAGLAAAATVATIVGVAVSSSGRSQVPAADMQTKVAVMDAAPATEAPAMSSEMASDMSVEMSAADGAFVDACPDDLRPTIIPVATIDGEDVEIHWSAAHGVVVYRISDCSVVLATTP